MQTLSFSRFDVSPWCYTRGNHNSLLRSKLEPRHGNGRIGGRELRWCPDDEGELFVDRHGLALRHVIGRPSPAQSSIELDNRDKMEPAGRRERQLRVEQTALGGEHV